MNTKYCAFSAVPSYGSCWFFWERAWSRLSWEHRHLSFLYLVFNGIGSDLRRCIGCGSFEHPVNFKFFNLWGTLGSDHFIATDFNPLINCIILSHMTKYGPCLRHSTGCVTFWRIEIRPYNIIRAYGSGWCAAWQVDLMLANRYDMIIAYFA